jgi:hypothetical protein
MYNSEYLYNAYSNKYLYKISKMYDSLENSRLSPQVAFRFQQVMK